MLCRSAARLSSSMPARAGAGLTAWGGLGRLADGLPEPPVATSLWEPHGQPVREASAVAFATAFYARLLDGKTLVEGTSAARAAARKFPDASCMSYRVFGHPQAR